MILKAADGREHDIKELERLLLIAPPAIRPKIEQELRTVRTGIKGEMESAYLIDFDFKDSQKTLVIHDLRLEVNGRVAQIDHLLIHRTLNCFVLETKHLHAGLQITEEGDFKQWNDFEKRYKGMASPLAQNERHILVLKDAFDLLRLPSRAGITLKPTFHSYVLVSPSARIDRPKKFDSSHVIKADVLLKTIEKQFEKTGVVETLTNFARIVSTDDLRTIGRQLLKKHKPTSINYLAKFVLTEKVESKREEPVVLTVAPNCSGRVTCDECGAEVDKKVIYFCRLKKDRFKGKILCRECQQIPEAETL